MNKKEPKRCQAAGCRNPAQAKGYCLWPSHQALRTDADWLRKLAAKAAKPKKVYTIPKQSKKQAKEEAKYNRRVKAWKKEPGNTVCAVPGCGKPTEDCHHSKLRGIYLNDESTWIPMCRPHHDAIKLNSEWAKSMNLIFSRVLSEKYK